MCKIKDINRFKSIRFMLALMIVSVLIFSTCIMEYTKIVTEIKDTKYNTIKQIKSEQYEKIYMYMNILIDDASIEAKTISEKIESDIKTQCDLDILKEDLDNNIINDKLYNIFRSNINGKYLNEINNSKNGVIIMTHNGIIEDLNYHRVSDKVRSWDDIIETSYNPDMSEDAKNKINNHSNEIIALETKNMIQDKHKKITNITYDSLKDIYINEGFEGLKNYQILVPVYITNTGDIFGQSDIKFGVDQKNKVHKFIIIQEFNLYDQLLHEYPEMVNHNDESLTQTNIVYNNLLDDLYILGLFFILAIITMVFCFAMMYNNFIIGYLVHCNNDNYNNEEIKNNKV